MPTGLTLQEQIAMAGLAYGRRHDISYRAGLVTQVFGSALLAVLYPLDSPFYTVGVLIFETGVLLSALYLLVWMPWIKIIVLAFVFVGIALQVFGLYALEEYAGSIIIGGIGIVCTASAGMAGKEAYCFKYREGWLLMLLGFPSMVLANLLCKESRVFNSIGFSLLFLLLLSLTGRKLKEPLLPKCSATGGCAPPQKIS
jgi:uncharacterized integral membrane protein